MTIKYVMAIVFGLWIWGARAQNIAGTIRSASGQAIPSASITVLNSARQSTSTKDGRFSLSLDKGIYQLSFSAVGYATAIKKIEVNGSAQVELNISLARQIQSLDEVVITAERSETDMQKTPLAVSVISARDIEQYRVWSFSDMSALAPGLQTVEHGGSTSSLFINIRGVMGLHSQSAVATYIDGVYQFESFGVPLQFNNIERIEVLRGPQGTLYGRNAFGGVINIITKKPTNKTQTFAQADFGNYRQQRYNAGFRTPLINNKLFLGVSGMFNQYSGMYTNTLTNNRFDRPQSITGGINLKYLISGRWDAGFDGRYERNEDYGSYPWATSDSALMAQPYAVGRNSSNIELRNNLTTSLKLNYAGNAVNFQSISAYQHYKRGFPELLDTDFSPVDLVKTQNDWAVKTFTQELRLSSNNNTARKLDWNIGTYLWLAPDGTNVNAGFRTAAGGGTTIRRNSVFDNRGIAFFGQATYRITEKLSATAGLRYDAENRKLSQERITAQADGTLTENIPYTASENSFGTFTPKLAFSYAPTNAALLYVQYTRGFRAGGLNAFAPAPEDVPFDPEYSDNYEIGIKNSLFDNRLRLNLTGFFLQQRDQQISVIENGFFLTRNTGKMNNLGAEIELSALPLSGLQVEWNASTSDAEYAALTAFSGGQNRDFSGNKPLFNPAFSSFLAIQYTKPFGNAVSAFIRGEHRYTGAYYFNFDNAVRQSPFNLYNTRFGATYRNYEIAFWGRNLGDTRYRTWATGVFLMSTPRTYGLTLTANF